jgi:hypothetical protein
MKARLPILLTAVLAVALAAPGAMAKDNAKAKGKDKQKKQQKVEKVDRDRDGRGDHDGDRDDRDDDRNGQGKVTICHIPPGNASAKHTITVSESAWSAHQKHGDHRGACPGTGHGDGDGRGDAFDRLDRDDDGRISSGEWPFGDDAFRRLDRDDDGGLVREEFARHGEGPSRRRFEDLDRDRNGRISRAEWPFGRDSFNRANRDDNDWISPDEYRRF